MPIGLAQPVTTQRAIPRQAPLFTMPWAGAITYDGKLYGLGYPITGIDTNGYFNVWDDPTHLEAYRNILTASNAKIFGTSLDAANRKIYVGPFYANSPRTCRVWQWNLVTEQLTVLVNDVALGIGAPQTGTQSALCNDGTYIYVVYYTQSSINSWIFKFRISDGSLVTKLQFSPPPVGATAYGASRVELIDPNNLVVVGLGNNWVALVPTDLSTVTTIVQPAGAGTQLFGLQCIEGFAWVGNYSFPVLYRYNSDLTSLTTFDYSANVGAGTGGVFDHRWDGDEYLWAALGDYTVLGIDVDTGDADFVFPELRGTGPLPRGGSDWQPGMVWPMDDGVAIGDFTQQANATSFGYWIQFGTAPTQPREIGRGVGGRR